jgi:uroporphyrinogen-III synthase
MRLLLTRPAADAISLAEPLAAQGHDIIISPAIHIEPNDTPLPAPDTVQGLVFTSANGVSAMAARFADKRDYELWAQKPAYGVGPQTCAALAKLHWPRVHQAAGDVKTLAATIQETFAGSDLLHIAGRHQAGDLAALLSQSSVRVTKAVLYEAVAAEALTPLAEFALADTQAPLEGVLLYSKRSAQIFVSLYRAHLGGLNSADTNPLTPPRKPPHKLMAYCLSAPIAEHMQSAGFETRTAATPDNQAMLALTARG